MSPHIRVLVIDDEAAHAEAAAEALERAGFETAVAVSGPEGLEGLTSHAPDVVVTDLKMPGADGMAVLREARRLNPGAKVILITAYADIDSARAAFKQGAFDYLVKPLDIGELRTAVERAGQETNLTRTNQQLRRRLDDQFGFESITGNTPQMRKVVALLQRIAPTSATVLIVGESGTGKERVANVIHQNSPRNRAAFVALNVASFPEGIIESELFGHEKGAFTGASSRRAGVFEYADGGTLFLDEVSELPPATQVRLLRVLEEQEFMRVGGTSPIKVDVRLIAATNKDLEEAVEQGQFREDLYYRLNVVLVHIPPLRERRDDIPLLVQTFIGQYRHQAKARFQGISGQAMELLKQYNWPGNVRELRNLVESLMVLSPDREVRPEDIPKYLRPRATPSANLPVRVEKTREQAEREIIYKTLLGLRADVAELKGLLAGEHRPRPPMGVHSRHTDLVEEGDQAQQEPAGETVQFPVGTDMSRVERDMIRKTLQHTGGNRKKAAKLLGIGERTLYRKIQAYGLNG
ncbi:MAG: sigma-54-dependent Fis family transcriptional regulator [Planctomycetes bacterium]|nr:sigma-54-dependent Fis family transcriptional regulator [Planctomycetota bacterium]